MADGKEKKDFEEKKDLTEKQTETVYGGGDPESKRVCPKCGMSYPAGTFHMCRGGH